MSAKKAKRVGTTTVESAATTSPDVDVLKNTILITKQAVKAKVRPNLCVSPQNSNSPIVGLEFRSKQQKQICFLHLCKRHQCENGERSCQPATASNSFLILSPFHFQKDNGASYLNKGVGMVITFPATFPASPPSVYLIGVDHPHVASSAITDMNNGGHYCTHRFNSSVWSSNNCTGEAFADTVVNAILDLDNKAPNWSSPYPHHSQAKWTRAACLTKSVAAPTLPASFT